MSRDGPQSRTPAQHDDAALLADPEVRPRGLFRIHRDKLAITYVLTALENLCEVLYPFVIGLAVDGLLANNPCRLGPLALVWVGHLVVGVSRHAYDTRVFTRIYAEFATSIVNNQRKTGIEPNQLAGRVALSREVIDFLETEIPALGRAVGRLIGATVMLFAYDIIIGVLAVFALLPIGAANLWFGRRTYRLARGLNNRLEREIRIVARAPLRAVRRHFEHLRYWRVRISDAEVWTWTAVEIVMIALTLLVLLRLTAEDGASAGAIYAVLAYIFTLYEAVEVLPGLVQSVSRVRDIGNRLSELDDGDLRCKQP